MAPLNGCCLQCDSASYHEGELAAFLTFVHSSLGELTPSLPEICMLLFIFLSAGAQTQTCEDHLHGGENEKYACGMRIETTQSAGRPNGAHEA